MDVVGITEVVALTGALVGGAPLAGDGDLGLGLRVKRTLNSDSVSCAIEEFDNSGLMCRRCAILLRPALSTALRSAGTRDVLGEACGDPALAGKPVDLAFGSPGPAVHAGISARQRKAELERLNDQLRKINLSLRQQARSQPACVATPVSTLALRCNGVKTVMTVA